MKANKHQIIEDKMLQEFRDFVIKNGYAPTVRELDDKTQFTYGYASYCRRFRSREDILKQINMKQYIVQKPCSKRVATKYNRNLMAGKIRILLMKNPNAGYQEMTELFGDLTRSIRVTYYRLYKELYNKKGSLKKCANHTED